MEKGNQRMETGGNPWVYPGGGSWEGGVANKGAGNPAKTEARGIFPAKTAALRGKMEKIASKTGKNGFGTGKKLKKSRLNCKNS